VDPDDFQNAMETSSSEDTSLINFYEDPVGFSRDVSHIVEKCPFCNVEQSFKKFLDLDIDADDFQTLNNQLFLVHRCTAHMW